MPLLMPAEPWQATGRWDLYGDEMFKLTDKKGTSVLPWTDA